MTVHEVNGPDHASQLVTEILDRVKSANALSPVLFVTDNYRQGGQLVNQFIAEYLNSKNLKSIVGVSQITVDDLLEKFCDILDFDWTFERYEVAVSARVNLRLYSGQSFLDPKKLIPSTVSQIQKLVISYKWVDFEDSDLNKAVENSSSTKTAKDLFKFSKSINEDLAQQNILSPSRMLKLCQDPKSIAALSHHLKETYLIALTESCPKKVMDLIQAVSTDLSFSQLRIGETSAAQIEGAGNIEAASFPDVMTEVRAGVSKAIEFLLEAGKAEDVAILYSEESDYAKHLRFALDDAGLAWNGTAPDTFSTTKLAAFTLDALSLVLGVPPRKLDRKFLLRVIRSGLLKRQEDFAENFSWMSVERFIRENGFFNQAENWIPQLTKIASGEAELEKQLAEYELQPLDNEDPIEQTKRKLNDARAARVLLDLISKIQSFTDGIEQSKNALSEQAVMVSLLGLITSLAGDPKKRRLADAEKACFEAIDQLAQQVDTAASALSDAVIPQVVSKLQELFSTGNNFKKGPGIFVGNLTQHPLRQIRYQVLLGMSEGAFPRRRQEDPLSPDDLRTSLGVENEQSLPTSSSQVKTELRNVLSVLSSAKSVYVSFSRNGLIGQGSGNFTAAFDGNSITPTRISSFEDFVDLSPNAVTALDLQRKAVISQMSGADVDRKNYPGLDSAVALYSNEFGPLSGNIGSGLKMFNFANYLSASAVETYLKCPHKFFVTRILGFKFEDDDDEVETLRALDFGSMVHKSFELLHHYCVENDMMPDFGEPYSQAAIQAFKRIFNEQCDDIIQRGQAGWLPLFEQKRRNFLALTELYFELEHEFRSIAPRAKSNSPKIPLRADLQLRPHLAEFSFDSHGVIPLEIPVISTGGNAITLKFKGQMDRVDKSRPDVHAGVVDFKTSKAGTIVASKDELVQDLLYSHALRKNLVDFANVRFVSFAYITLNNPKDSRIKRIREVDKNLYIDEINGGFKANELIAKMNEVNQAQDAELLKILTRFVDANEKGLFPPFAESKSAGYCEVCADSFGDIRAEAIYKKVPK